MNKTIQCLAHRKHSTKMLAINLISQSCRALVWESENSCFHGSSAWKVLSIPRQVTFPKER